MKKLYGLLVIIFFFIINYSNGQFGAINSFTKYSSTMGGFTGGLIDGDNLHTVTNAGDINGDGVEDMIFGANGYNNSTSGQLFVVFMNSNGSIDSTNEINNTNQLNFSPSMGSNDQLGNNLTTIDDLDGDGRKEIVVGSLGYNNGTGRAFVLFLDANGDVKRYEVIDNASVNNTLPAGAQFTVDLASIGDLDGDGVNELAIGAKGVNDGGTNKGAVYILFLDTSASVTAFQKISATAGGFADTVSTSAYFGNAITALGDVSGDNVPDIAVGAPLDDYSGKNKPGSMFVMHLTSTGTVNNFYKFNSYNNNLGFTLSEMDQFGFEMANIGDHNADGVDDLVVSARRDSGTGVSQGAVYVLFMDYTSSGVPSVIAHQKIDNNNTGGGFAGSLDDNDLFGNGMGTVADYDNDGLLNLAVGARSDDDGGSGRGAIYVFSLEGSQVGMSEGRMRKSFGVKPNPVSNHVNIESTTAIIELRIHDVLGKEIYHFDNPETTNNLRLNLKEISGNNKGIYIISVRHQDGSINTEKVVLK